MSKTEPIRKPEYQSVDEILSDVKSLASAGYSKHGNWTLGQACGHVADWASFPLDGFPKPPAFVRAMFWFMQKTGTTKKMANKIMADGFKPGMPTAPVTIPADSYADHDGIAKLEKVINRLKQHSGALHLSPLFGEMDMETHLKVTILHSQHHFGYFQQNQ